MVNSADEAAELTVNRLHATDEATTMQSLNKLSPESGSSPQFEKSL